jgi:hypothetical protein
MPEVTAPKTPRFFVIMYHETWPGLVFYNCETKETALEMISDKLAKADPDILKEIDIHMVQGTAFDVSRPHQSTMVHVDSTMYTLIEGKLCPVSVPEVTPAKLLNQPAIHVII